MIPSRMAIRYVRSQVVVQRTWIAHRTATKRLCLGSGVVASNCFVEAPHYRAMSNLGETVANSSVVATKDRGDPCSLTISSCFQYVHR